MSPVDLTDGRAGSICGVGEEPNQGAGKTVYGELALHSMLGSLAGKKGRGEPDRGVDGRCKGVPYHPAWLTAAQL